MRGFSLGVAMPVKDADQTLTGFAEGNGDWSQHKIYVLQLLKTHNRDINAIFERLRGLEQRMAIYIGAVGVLVVVAQFLAGKYL